MYKYQNVSKESQVITANGNINPRIVKAGDTVLSNVAIENPNFKYLGEEQQNTSGVSGTQVSQPNMITEASPLNNETNKETQ